MLGRNSRQIRNVFGNSYDSYLGDGLTSIRHIVPDSQSEKDLKRIVPKILQDSIFRTKAKQSLLGICECSKKSFSNANCNLHPL